MTQVSKRYLSSDVQKRMFEVFINAVSKAKYRRDVASFLTDLLSPTERIMLAKRLAIAYLLVKKSWTYREISQILKVSLATIQRVSLVLNVQGDGYRKIVNSLLKDEQIENFMNKVADAITVIPPGGANWKQWRKEREAEKRSRTKAF
ncbi:MAG: hypothetical protein G01um10145_281 [Microgenomates group bacterium Gr01-1014_5]|nr:MAG: hypothetical protein G01um10145_281 [Microgenomates group bacterium Gr01-1014_5]